MTDSSRTTIPRLTRPHPIAGSDEEVTESMHKPSPDDEPPREWTIDQALTYAHIVLSMPVDPSRPGFRQLARALVSLHRATSLSEQDRMILQTLAWDRQAGETWPTACGVIQRWIEGGGK